MRWNIDFDVIDTSPTNRCTIIPGRASSIVDPEGDYACLCDSLERTNDRLSYYSPPR